LVDELLHELIPDWELLIYGVPLLAFVYWVAVSDGPVPSLAIVGGVLAGGLLAAAYSRTGLQRDAIDGEYSTADWVALVVFCLGIGGFVLYSRLDAANRPAISLFQCFGFVTGTFLGHLLVDDVLPTALYYARNEER
jgi:hypothetical protein